MPRRRREAAAGRTGVLALDQPHGPDKTVDLASEAGQPRGKPQLSREDHDRLVKALADLLLADLLRYPPGK
jgi:hypothetical protein